MNITRITRHPRRDRVRIHLDGEAEPRLELSAELLVLAGLGVGDLLDPERLRALEAEDEAYRARDTALRLLGHRPRSRVEIRRALERRGSSGPTVDRTIAWLDERGYLDDRAFGEAFVRDRLRLRPRGTAALVAELRRKGVDEGTARAAIAAVLEAEAMTESALARRAAAEWARRNARLLRDASRDPERRRVARRRLYGHLSRRGFPPDPIRAAVAGALGD